MFKHKYLRKQTAAVLLTLLCLLGAAPAAADNGVQSIAQAYSSDSSLQKGTIVELDSHDSAKVKAATNADSKRMQGVVVAPSDAPATLTPSTSTGQQQVYVASTGRYEALVSTQNGAIAAGDYITVSSLSGVGMKADSNEGVVLGRATAPFDGRQGVSGTAQIHDSSRISSVVAIGRIPINLAIAANPLAVGATQGVPSFLAKATKAVSDKPVNAARIYFSLAVLLVSVMVAASLLYSGVRSGMVAIGRNPLARPSIMRGLVQVVLTSLIIFVIGLFAVYLLLKL